MRFKRLGLLPYSRRWTVVKVKECNFFAVKLDGWFAYREHLQNVRKKTHRLTSCK